MVSGDGGGGEGTAPCHSLYGTQSLLRGYEGHICCVTSKQGGRSQSLLSCSSTSFSLLSWTSVLGKPVLCLGLHPSPGSLSSHIGSLPRACRGHLPPWAPLILECWMCGIPGGSVQPRPLGEDKHLIGMLATLGEAERGEIKRSLL